MRKVNMKKTMTQVLSYLAGIVILVMMYQDLFKSNLFTKVCGKIIRYKGGTHEKH